MTTGQDQGSHPGEMTVQAAATPESPSRDVVERPPSIAHTIPEDVVAFLIILTYSPLGYIFQKYWAWDPRVVYLVALVLLYATLEALRYVRRWRIEDVEFIFSGEELQTLLHKGCHFLKMRSRGRTYKRFYVVDEQNRLVYDGSKKPGRKKNEEIVVDISDITDIREGWETETFKQKKKKNVQQTCCFSLVFGPKDKTLDLVADTEELRDKWVKGLRFMRKKKKGGEITSHFEDWIECKFRSADTDNKGYLTFDEVLDKLARMHIPIDRERAKKFIKRIRGDKDNKSEKDSKTSKDPEAISITHFIPLYFLAIKRVDLDCIFEKYAEGTDVMDLYDLADFWRRQQHNADATREDIQRLLQAHEPIKSAFQLGLMTKQGFLSLLLDQHIFNPDHRRVYQDMEQPLAHYYIATSHNTYLTEDQIRGPSSVDAYARVLLKGCRCVELDCWDGPNNEPIIYHGRTLTSKILFRDVVKTINDNAFQKSSYPVILSIENHCSLVQQKIMAKYFKDIFGAKICTDAVSLALEKLPSPESLKGKILIKNKKLPNDVEGDADVVVDEEELDEDLSVEDLENGNSKTLENGDSDAPPPSPTPTTPPHLTRDLSLDSSIERLEAMDSINLNTTGSTKSIEYIQQQEATSQKRKESSGKVSSLRNTLLRRTGTSGTKGSKDSSSKRQKVKIKLAKELSDLVSYCQAGGFRSFQHSMMHQKCFEMSSFVENKTLALIRDEPIDFVDHTKRQLIRTYPNGRRVDSSNYCPLPMWNVGCQLVALNYQTGSKPMDLNEAMFTDNGKCGYVLKPDFLRKPESTFSCFGPFSNAWQKSLKIKIISCSQLPVTKTQNPYIKVIIDGVDSDHQKYKTKTIKDDGFNPHWNEEATFQVKVPELAFVRFAVHDYESKSKDNFLGQYTLPFNSLLPGYRHVPLLSKRGASLSPACVFIHVSKE
ncbi:1-phosphatidylinositol 4,5-bisphosphate phosphodiesterase delta-1 isoform X2 [Lingula anatina]|uniref:Phosphoinositide phospholipase C n=1 Tax=Lingula anatina TaxID=7574 RepID=A0A1S3JD05_LINAN|nr:1-phosphatidylinositol 4,5-bisphosphate phosphodiesterase delta-1 isoform X2 [Lingula anatina]XP_013407771.1 1-phosphatidylinositol 4,5-bisphosphate phosphodiesterase delta-1 isoform X2 [Lingula anatina]XP_013407772.1 1-phosphatidylinositol 4,5-bisphosphate phosphodiesterase delta-1 isoform X2 [Lingula anatina]|eukprot:XP_013407769.1 1-phosphatidylinositol 4,5-bisphosphate phosphodiesterase delta-1 isoform X2 [Lingula anatina]